MTREESGKNSEAATAIIKEFAKDGDVESIVGLANVCITALAGQPGGLKAVGPALKRITDQALFVERNWYSR